MAAIHCLASSISCFDGFPWRTVDSSVVIFDVSPASRAFTHLVTAAFLCVAADLRLLFPYTLSRKEKQLTVRDSPP